MRKLGLAYLEGTWTPVITFSTAGDLSVTYSQQVGRYWRIGNMVTAQFRLATSAFTHTTAANAARITGLPYASNANAPAGFGTVMWQGITKALYTHVTPYVDTGLQYINLATSGSAVGIAVLAAADFPTGGTVVLAGSVTYSI